MKKLIVYLSGIAFLAIVSVNVFLFENISSDKANLQFIKSSIAQSETDDEKDSPTSCTEVCSDGETWEGIENNCDPGETDCSPYNCTACDGGTITSY
jgi:uncharacterized protein YxeA